MLIPRTISVIYSWHAPMFCEKGLTVPFDSNDIYHFRPFHYFAQVMFLNMCVLIVLTFLKHVWLLQISELWLCSIMTHPIYTLLSFWVEIWVCLLHNHARVIASKGHFNNYGHGQKMNCMYRWKSGTAYTNTLVWKCNYCVARSMSSGEVDVVICPTATQILVNMNIIMSYLKSNLTLSCHASQLYK